MFKLYNEMFEELHPTIDAAKASAMAKFNKQMSTHIRIELMFIGLPDRSIVCVDQKRGFEMCRIIPVD